MKKLFFPALLCTCILICGGPLHAQDTAATIIYGEGYGFTVLRGNDELYYDVLYDDVVGFELLEGDYISTDEGTLLELQLVSSTNVLKISENTSFQIASVSDSGGGRFALTYGRVRAKVEKLIGTDEFQIYGASAVAGVRGTDFGYDIIAEQDEEKQQFETIAQIYCFEGKVEVAKIKKKAPPAEPAEEVFLEEEILETVIIEANQMVSLAVSEEVDPLKKEFIPRQIEEEINIFWDENDFIGELIDVPEPAKEEPVTMEKPEGPESVQEDKVTEEAEEAAEEAEIFQIQEEERKTEVRKNFFVAGTVVVGVGVVTEVIGILLNFFGADWFGGDAGTYQDIGTALMVTGGGVTFGGLLTYLGVLVNR